MNDTEEFETQKKIYGLITRQPGLNIATISDMLQIPSSLVIYHIRFLERHDLITIVKEPGFTRCFIKGQLSEEEKRFFFILRQEIPFQIVVYLLKHPFSKHGEILRQFHFSKSTLSYYLKKMIQHHILDVQILENEQRYMILDEAAVIRFLMKHKPSMIAFGVKDTWADITVQKKGKLEK